MTCLLFLERYYALLARNTRSLKAQNSAQLKLQAMEKQATNLFTQTKE